MLAPLSNFKKDSNIWINELKNKILKSLNISFFYYQKLSHTQNNF